MRRALNIDLSRDVLIFDEVCMRMCIPFPPSLAYHPSYRPLLCLLIFDEAHNIERVCADAASFNLTTLELAGAVRARAHPRSPRASCAHPR